MKQGLKQWMHAASVAAAAAVALAVFAPSPAFAQATGIANTKHNLGSGAGPAGRNQVSAADTAEICVFCHTPHGADRPAGVTDVPPLWNKRLTTGATYQLYNTSVSTTLDGQVASVGSVSIACLSCHDGAQAMDNIINAPGSGLYDSTGGGTNGRAYTWSGPTVDTATGRLNAGIALLGADLRDDHPIGIEYCGGGLTGSAANATPGLATGTCTDADFRQPWSGTINGQGVWWVQTGPADTARTRTDMILYNRTFGASVGPAVECASCHDPHVSQGQSGPNGQVAGATFLRISNDNSAVCLACHTK